MGCVPIHRPLRGLLLSALSCALAACPSTTSVRPDVQPMSYPIAAEVPAAERSAGQSAVEAVSELGQRVTKGLGGLGEDAGCPMSFSVEGAKSGYLGEQIAQAARRRLGFVERSGYPPAGLKCAQQASNVLKLANVPIAGSHSVTGLVESLKHIGWCESREPIPGAVAFANPLFGNGERSHVGIVGDVDPSLEADTVSSMNLGLRNKYRYKDPKTGNIRPLTIYHNAGREMVGKPQGDSDRLWFSRVKFLVPPESCGGRS